MHIYTIFYIVFNIFSRLDRLYRNDATAKPFGDHPFKLERYRED